MTKKSAAKMKPVDGGKSAKQQTPEEIRAELEQRFDQFKEGELFKLDTLLDKQDFRWDTYASIAQDWRSWFNENPDWGTLFKLVTKVHETHAKCRIAMEKLTFEDMLDWEDPFLPISETAAPRSLADVFESMVIFSSVRPWGENAEKMAMEIQDRMPDED